MSLNHNLVYSHRQSNVSFENLVSLDVYKRQANIITPLFGGIPATGAIARTMTKINNGGKIPVAGLIHAVVLLLILLFLMPLAQYIPMALSLIHI